MDLNQQLKILIDQAPNYGVPSQIIKKGFAPILKVLALELQHLEYFVLQTPEQSWVLKVIANRSEPQQQKKVIYAYAALEDALKTQNNSDDELIPLSLPVTHLIFQLFALKQVDSIIFLDQPANLMTGIEIKRSDLENLIQKQLEQFKNIPPNLA